MSSLDTSCISPLPVDSEFRNLLFSLGSVEFLPSERNRRKPKEKLDSLRLKSYLLFPSFQALQVIAYSRGTPTAYEGERMLSGGARGIADTSELDNQLNDPNQYDNPPDPATLSVVEHLRTLSDFGKLTLVYIVGAIFYLLLVVDKVSVAASSTLQKYASPVNNRI